MRFACKQAAGRRVRAVGPTEVQRKGLRCWSLRGRCTQVTPLTYEALIDEMLTISAGVVCVIARLPSVARATEAAQFFV